MEGLFSQLKKEKEDLILQRQQLLSEHQKLVSERTAFENSKLKEGKMAATMVYGMVEQYSDDEEWSSWTERLEEYFSANDIKDEKKKLSILLTLMGK